MKKEYSIKRAALINASGKYSTILLQLFVNAILSRILTPNDYGIVAVITVFSTLFISLSDMGFGAAIIQHKDLTKEEIDGIFTITIFIAIILALIFSGASFFIAEFYNNCVYIPLGILLSVSLLFNALNMVPNGIMNRNKKFMIIAIRTVCAYAISALIAIIVACLGGKYYAIVIQTMFSSIVIFLWNLFETRPKIRIKGCLHSVSKVINYSGYQFAFTIVNYFSRNLDNLLTGKFMGSTALGYYNKAYSLMLYPINNLTGIISPVLHPLLSDYQKNKEIIYKKYMIIVKILALIGAFIGPFCHFASNEIIMILYGKQWGDSIKCFEILSFAIFPQLIGSSAGSIYQSLGKTKLLFYNGVLNTIITIIAILIGVLIGKNVIILSKYVACAYIIHFITVYFMLIHIGFEYQFLVFLKEFIPEIVILLLMIAFIFTVNISYNNIILSFFMKFIVLAVYFVFMLLVTGEFKILVRIIHKNSK